MIAPSSGKRKLCRTALPEGWKPASGDWAAPSIRGLTMADSPRIAGPKTRGEFSSPMCRWSAPVAMARNNTPPPNQYRYFIVSSPAI
jgi:hypothetical protein